MDSFYEGPISTSERHWRSRFHRAGQIESNDHLCELWRSRCHLESDEFFNKAAANVP